MLFKQHHKSLACVLESWESKNGYDEEVDDGDDDDDDGDGDDDDDGDGDGDGL